MRPIALIAYIFADSSLDPVPDGKQVFWMTVASTVSISLLKGWDAWVKWKEKSKIDKVEEETTTIKRYDDLLTRIGQELEEERQETKALRAKVEVLTIQVERSRGEIKWLRDMVKRQGIKLDSIDTPDTPPEGVDV